MYSRETCAGSRMEKDVDKKRQVNFNFPFWHNSQQLQLLPWTSISITNTFIVIISHSKASHCRTASTTTTIYICITHTQPSCLHLNRKRRRKNEEDKFTYHNESLLILFLLTNSQLNLPKSAMQIKSMMFCCCYHISA